MNRYDHDFRGQTAFVQSIPIHKVGYATFALLTHWSLGFCHQDDDEVAKQFDLNGMLEFWEIQLSEPMTCKEFGHTLAVHLAGARAPLDGFEAHIRLALRKARSIGAPWFMVIPDPPPSNKLDPKAWMGFIPSDTVIVPADPPADGIDLNKLRVLPREAALWMLANAMRQHLVPPSLAAYLSPPASVDDVPVVPVPEINTTRQPVPLANPVDVAPAEKKVRNQGGRPAIYDWGGGLAFLGAYIVENDPKDKTELKHALTKWFNQRGKYPDEREVRRRVDEMWDHLRK